MAHRFKRPKSIPARSATNSTELPVVGYPDFAQQVSERFPKHCACWGPLYETANHIVQRSEAGHRLAVLLSAEAAFNAFNAIILLALNGLGPDAMVVCRSLLETAMGTAYLAADEARLPNYIEYGRLVQHRIAKRWEAGQRVDLINATKAGHDSAMNRFPKKNLSWHQLQNHQLAAETGYKDVYDDYYPLWSSIAHGDFLATTSRLSPEGRFQPPPAWEFIDDALELGAEITARMFYQVTRLLKLGYESTVDRVIVILDELEPKRAQARRYLISTNTSST